VILLSSWYVCRSLSISSHSTLTHIDTHTQVQLEDSYVQRMAQREVHEHARTNSMDSLRIAIVNRADIICATLSGSGLSIIDRIRFGTDTRDNDRIRNAREYRKHCENNKKDQFAAMFKKPPRRFGTIVVDEAAQCNELLSIVPFRFSSERVIMVGDPKQLSSVTFSRQASHAGYDRSLFERLQSRGVTTHFLDTQYRCHPHIANFSSNRFYQGRLRNGENVMRENYSPLVSTSRYLKPFMYVFFSLSLSFIRSPVSFSRNIIITTTL